MLVSTARVLLMTPALGLFYGGLVRSRNALNTGTTAHLAMDPITALHDSREEPRVGQSASERPERLTIRRLASPTHLFLERF